MINKTNFTVNTNTLQQFADALKLSKEIFEKKLIDYGPSWRIMRPMSITDQLYIKAKRIRTLELTNVSMVGEGILPEFIAIVNYGIIGLIQLSLPLTDDIDIDNNKAVSLYEKFASEAEKLMIAKNHDYGEAWRNMRVNSYTDLILTKLQRIKQIEANGGHTVVSEGISSNYLDIINYAIFGIIKLTEDR
ncbi:MAG: DUF1599 domain-containing protein [Paramuribaculum sp.]|nr:DUF1599 domain-containing protein [Paramuribaculum sp.]